MLRVRNWSIQRRLLVGFSIVLVPHFALAALGAVGVRALWHTLLATREEAVVDLWNTTRAEHALDRFALGLSRYEKTGDVEDLEETRRRLSGVVEAMRVFDTTPLQVPAERQLLGMIQSDMR